MKNMEKIKEATMQDFMKKFGLLLDECAAQEKRIFELEEKVAALSSQLKTEKKGSLTEYPHLESAFKVFEFPHGQILQLKSTNPDSLADYAFVAVKRFYPTTQKLECYAFYVHERSGLDKIYIADEQVKNAYSKPSEGFENYIATRVGIDMNQGWRICGGVMVSDEMQKMFNLAESIGYKAYYSFTANPDFSRGYSTCIPIKEAWVCGPLERIKKKNHRHG